MYLVLTPASSTIRKRILKLVWIIRRDDRSTRKLYDPQEDTETKVDYATARIDECRKLYDPQEDTETDRIRQ